MDELKVVLETKEKTENSGIGWSVFWGTILIPIAALAITYLMKGQEIDAKNFELAIKILESNKESDPEVKKWAKETFFEYAKIKPSDKALESLDHKPFIYDYLEMEDNKVSISLESYGKDRFQLSGSNSYSDSIVINGIDVVNSSKESCYLHATKGTIFTPYTSFTLAVIETKYLKRCFTDSKGVNTDSVINVIPERSNSLDSIKSMYGSVEIITLHISWSSDSSLLSTSNSSQGHTGDRFIHKSYYLMTNKVIKEAL